MKLIHSLLWSVVVILYGIRRRATFVSRRIVGLPYHSDHDFHVNHVRHGLQILLYFGGFSQIAVGGLSVWVWTEFGGSNDPLIIGLIILVILSVWFDKLIWRESRSPAPGHANGCLAWLFCVGFFAGCAFLAFLILKLDQLLRPVLQVFTLAMMVLTVLIVVIQGAADRIGENGAALRKMWRRRLGWIFIWCGQVLGPFFAGWAGASIALPLVRKESATVREWLDTNPPQLQRAKDWKAGDEQRICVAMTLSGGGYRAAVTHAGVLAALDDQGIPINILSTVSGGSIVGTLYVLGVPPREFAARLERQKPGLPDAILHLRSAYGDRSVTYARHFQSVYYGNRTLDHLPDSPLLLVNVTNLRSDTRFAREVFRKGWAFPELETSNRLADIVTASAAYPGPFGPIKLPWQVREPSRTVLSDHYLVDGGVVENLGIEGVRFYLNAMDWMQWYEERPDLLIISDASGYGGSGERMVVNPSADAMLLRASDIEFDFLHNLLYTELTGREDLPAQIASCQAQHQYYTIDYPKRFVSRGAPEPGSRIKVLTPSGIQTIIVTQPKLRTVVIPITMDATGELLKRHPELITPSGERATAIHARVKNLSTLKELDPQAVRDAFWLGYVLGRMYGPAIQGARTEIEAELNQHGLKKWLTQFPVRVERSEIDPELNQHPPRMPATGP